MKVILAKAKQAVKQSTKQLGNRRCSSANGFFTSEIVGAVTSLILMLTLGFISLAVSMMFSSSVYADYTISMITSGAHSIDVMSKAGGETGTSISEDAITVTTTCPSGYNLTLSTSVNNNNLYLDGDISNNTAGTYFTPADGTTALSSATNTWGYYYNSNSTTAPTESSIFSPVPVTGSATTIKTSTSTSDSFSIYYGIAVSSSMAPGTYKMIPDTNNSNHDGAIVYQLTMAQSCLPYTVVFNPTSTATGTNLSGTGTMSDQIIPAGVATALDSNTFTAPSGYEFDSWNTAQDGTGTSYTDGQSVIDLTTGGTSITLYAQWEKADLCKGKTALYDLVACRSKGVMTNDANVNTGIQAAITTDNSGVFKYNPSVFGASSDASNDYGIYFYRGILDSNLDGTSSTYGSAGDGVTHPNYVILDANGTKDTSDTCWRIVRTTGSGGVKMIYNGKWTGSTCANATTAAQVTTRAFNGTYSTYQQIVRVGYTYNSTYATNTSQSGTIAQIFGTNSDPSVNNTRSTIKAYIEDTWYPSTLGASSSNYTSILEPSAGYCNDRTMNTSTSWTSPLAESTIIASTYGTSGQQDYYFGAYPRNTQTSQPPSLTCGNRYSQIDRSTVDLYRYVSGSTGASNELKYPAALLTADEVAFAGSGGSTASQGSAYHYNSYLRSGSAFWLLSPYNRSSDGIARGFSLGSGGDFIGYFVYDRNGVRPAISLASGTTATSGSGTAADPWVVEAP